MRHHAAQWLCSQCLRRPLVSSARLAHSLPRPGPNSAPSRRKAFSTVNAAHQPSPSPPAGDLKAARIKSIHNVFPDPYPRLSVQQSKTLSCEAFSFKYAGVQENSTVDDDSVVIHGRVQSVRSSGSKLLFFDIAQQESKVQVLCNKRLLGDANPEKFREFSRAVHRGDCFSVTGNPHRTGRGELSLLATELPCLLSPCLHDIPTKIESEVSPFDRHVELRSSPRAADILRARSAIVQYIRAFFHGRSFMEVSTPILAAEAGGAVAKPFQTRATDIPEQPLSLRIAPELWLKRLVVSGFDRVFEIGSSFRNESVDRTHNPEFTTCESYEAFAELETLMTMTEQLLCGLARHVQDLNESLGATLNPTEARFERPFRRIDFIPGLEAAMQRKLPDLTGENALLELKGLLEDLSVPCPDQLTLPRLLDRLCGHYLEPQCQDPTFIINHPECLSPLSKSFVHPTAGQVVSARGELFVGGRELVNMYEEENSPFAQRRKFQSQIDTNDKENATGSIDESYLEVLEWGLPPTGGWGCGIERLTMLLTGAKRIDEVLSFGNLRHVAKSAVRGD